MTYASTPPAVAPVYVGFENGDTVSALSTQPGVLDHGDEHEHPVPADVIRTPARAPPTRTT